MKVVFMGTPEFAARSLKRILHSKHEVVTVVTVPDKPQGRGKIIQPSAVKKNAVENGAPVLQPENLKDPHFIQSLKKVYADVFVVVAFQILPPEVFTIPPKGTINAHASLLPLYRGAAPINRAIMNGDKKSGVTTMLIDEKIDTGAMLLQKEVDISSEMNAGELHDLLADVSADLLLESLSEIESGKAKPIAQDSSKATKAPKIFKKDCKINFKQSSEALHNFVRGLSPYPGAYCHYRGKQLQILKSSIITFHSRDSAQPGTIVKLNKKEMVVACGKGSVSIETLKPQGKKIMTIHEYLNGTKIKIGEKLD
jgi:methionyl-tRNA formyltransferase